MHFTFLRGILLFLFYFVYFFISFFLYYSFYLIIFATCVKVIFAAIFQFDSGFWMMHTDIANCLYCPYNRKLMISFVDSNFVVIGQTLFCPIHHQTLSSYSPFVLRLELPPVKARVAFVFDCNNASLFPPEFQRTLPSAFLRFTWVKDETRDELLCAI